MYLISGIHSGIVQPSCLHGESLRCRHCTLWWFDFSFSLTECHMSDIEMEQFVHGRSGLVFCFFTLQPLFSSFFVCETNKKPWHLRCPSAWNRKKELEWFITEILCLKQKKTYECSRKPFVCFSRAQITHVAHGSRIPSHCCLCSLFDSVRFVLVSPDSLVRIPGALSSLTRPHGLGPFVRKKQVKAILHLLTHLVLFIAELL